MAIQYSLTHRTNRMIQLNADIGPSAVIKIFSGTIPANCGAADTGTALVTFAGNASGFGTVASQVLTANPIASALASATGTAGYFRIYPSAATTTNAVVQGTCGVAGADMVFSNTSIAAGQGVNFDGFSDTAFGA